MEKGDFFVMLQHQNPNVGYVPMMTGLDENIAKFETKEAARDAAVNNPLGEAFGYEIFEMGCGSS